MDLRDGATGHLVLPAGARPGPAIAPRPIASAPARTPHTLAKDDPRERRRLACRRLLSPGRSGSAVALPLVPAVAADQSRSPALGRPPADREGRDQPARGAFQGHLARD